MCGIFGYVGHKKAAEVCVEGLKKLEYRGYDSAGFAGIQGQQLVLHKALGKVAFLEEVLHEEGLDSSIGIAHTRWATHGKPSQKNAHPHTDEQKTLAVVHNGIVENYTVLRDHLIQEFGVSFISETDTEVIAQSLGKSYHGDLFAAALETLQKLEGSFAIGVIHQEHPEKMIAIADQCPLIVAFSSTTKESFLCSDQMGLPDQELEIVYLTNKEIALLEKNKKPRFFDRMGTSIDKKDKATIFL